MRLYNYGWLDRYRNKNDEKKREKKQKCIDGELKKETSTRRRNGDRNV